MADPVTTTTPDFTGVIDQRFFLAPLGGPQNPVNYLDRFPEELYNKSIDSHLVRFLYSMLGPAGIGWLRKNYLEARLKLEDFGLETFDLDKFYGDPIGFGRILEEMYEYDPSGALTPEQWEEIRSKDAHYRNRAIDFVNGAKAGNTPFGMHLVARSGLGHEVEIFERYRYLWDQQTDDRIGVPNLGFTNSLGEMVVIPRRELPQSEVQTVTISGTPTGGTFRLLFPVGDTVVNQTQDIAYNADRYAIQLFIEAIPSIKANNVRVTGGPLPDKPISIQFTGDLAYLDVPQLQAINNLTGGIAPAISITTELSGVDQVSETVSIPPRDRRHLITALERIKPVTTIVTFEQGSGLASRQIWNSAFGSSAQYEVIRYVTGQAGVRWPAIDGSTKWIESGVEHKNPRAAQDLTHHYQGFHNIVSITAHTEAALADPNYESDSVLSAYVNEHVGSYTNYQQALFPLLAQPQTDVAQRYADMSLADYAEPLTVRNSTTGDLTALINGIYPISYQSLPGVPQIKYNDDQFYSSVERETGDDYLEIDLGSVQPINYIYFEASQKPYDITVSYDLLDLAPARNWQDVSLIPDLPSVTRLDYQVADTNPWKTVEMWVQNPRGKIIFTRFLRIKFARRNETDSPFTNEDGSYEQYSIEVKNLRVARSVG